MKDLSKNVETINSKKEMEVFISRLRPIASNNRNNKVILDLIEKSIEKCKFIDDKKSLVKLYEIKISQMEHFHENMKEISELVNIMKTLSKEIDYIEGLALTYNVEWFVEKYKGNKEKSKKSLNLSIETISLKPNVEKYTYFVCFYSYAIEQWLDTRDFNSSIILEECADYFYLNGYFHSFATTLCVLTVIYQQTQNKEKSMEIIRKILSNNDFLVKMPEEIKSIVDYFIGVSHKLSFNLVETEKHLLETERILKPIYKDSIYSRYYLTALSHLSATYALQGKLELALNQMKRVEELLEEEIALKNLDSFNKIQITHTFNLTKFYLHSRLHDFSIEKFQGLIHTIVSNVGTYHSNAMMLSEFLLNANLTKAELKDIKNLNNPSTRRVEHILDFLIGKESHDDKLTLQKINTLKRRPVEERMTNVEKAFADLLAAQEYYKINRFAEISPLLKKYENQTHKIEVLELRVSMEAFIQVGAFKNGDPLGPALQYMAIKKCRNYGFSRLENKLLDYLDIQRRDIRSLAI
jgi:tetratricopeptide (TPR) repeat protein